MASLATILPEHDWFIGEDYPINFRCFSFEQVRLSGDAAAGATTLLCAPLRASLASADKLFFERAGFMVKLSALAAVGATSLTVAALSGPLVTNDVGRKIKDLTGLALQWVLEDTQGGVTRLTKTPTLVNDPADPDSTPIRLAQVNVAAADCLPAWAGVNFHRLRQTDAGNLRTLAKGDATLKLD